MYKYIIQPFLQNNEDAQRITRNWHSKSPHVITKKKLSRSAILYNNRYEKKGIPVCQINDELPQK